MHSQALLVKVWNIGHTCALAQKETFFCFGCLLDLPKPHIAQPCTRDCEKWRVDRVPGGTHRQVLDLPQAAPRAPPAPVLLCPCCSTVN